MRNEIKPPFSHNGAPIWGSTQQLLQPYGGQSSERISRNGGPFNSRMEFMPNSGPPPGTPMMTSHPPNMPPPHLTGAPPFIPQNFRQQPQKFGANISILDSTGGSGMNNYPYQNFMSHHNAQQLPQQLPMSIKPPEEDSMWRCPTDPQQDALAAFRKWQRDSGTSVWGDPKENNGLLFQEIIHFLEKNIKRWQQYFEGENDDIFRTQSPSKQSNASKEQFGGVKSKEPEIAKGWGELPQMPELEKLNSTNLNNRRKKFKLIIILM